MSAHPSSVTVPRRPWGSRASRLAWLAALACLAPTAAQAQSVVSASASPSPFPTGGTIAISAAVQATASPASWCVDWEGCIFWPEPFLQVNGSNGFYDRTSGYWDEEVGVWRADFSDPGPGQTMLATTYTVTAGVTVRTAYRARAVWTAPIAIMQSAPPRTTAVDSVHGHAHHRVTLPMKSCPVGY